MTSFPLIDCCELLAIDPKTLRHWRQQAAMSLHVHPSDGRRKCLTQEQVQQLALLHGRILKLDEARLSASLGKPFLQGPPEEPFHQHLISEMIQEKIPSVVVSEKGDLSQKLSQLEAQVVAQQQQLTLLTQTLLLERELRNDQHPFSKEIAAHSTADPEIARSRHEELTLSTPVPQDGPRPLHPAELRARFLVLPPLIEYSATGTYVIVSSQEGEIPLVPDT